MLGTFTRTTLTRLALEIDGVYGPKTKEAVVLFQEKHGLQVDGVAGPITIQRIRSLMEGI